METIIKKTRKDIFPSESLVLGVLGEEKSKLEAHIKAIEAFQDDIDSSFGKKYTAIEFGQRLGGAAVNCSEMGSSERDLLFDLGLRLIEKSDYDEGSKVAAKSFFKMRFPNEYTYQRMIGRK